MGMILRSCQTRFAFPRPAILMGIVNVTPDSFSDGGQFLNPEAAVQRAMTLVEAGAEIIDIGGESTRPGAAPVSESEELCRVLPVFEALSGRTEAVLSIDTQKVAVARAALRAGAGMVNDIGANREDPEMWRLVAESGAAYVAMHMQGTPQTMHLGPAYGNVRREVADFFEDRSRKLSVAGVSSEQMVFDVGIGFGKTFEHNLELLAGLEVFASLGRPLLIGVSRKSFLGTQTGAGVGQRLPAALACTTWAVASGANIIRTHDVAATRQAVLMTEALMASSKARKDNSAAQHEN
jgi:dihydropteroate synthase